MGANETLLLPHAQPSGSPPPLRRWRFSTGRNQMFQAAAEANAKVLECLREQSLERGGEDKAPPA